MIDTLFYYLLVYLLHIIMIDSIRFSPAFGRRSDHPLSHSLAQYCPNEGDKTHDPNAHFMQIPGMHSPLPNATTFHDIVPDSIRHEQSRQKVIPENIIRLLRRSGTCSDISKECYRILYTIRLILSTWLQSLDVGSKMN